MELRGKRPVVCGSFTHTCGAQGDFLSTLCRIEGSVFPKVFLKSLLFAGVGEGAWLVYSDNVYGGGKWYEGHIGHDTDLHTYVGILISLMLSFRTNACYGRYVEGIHTSNALKNSMKNLMSQAAACVDGIDAKSSALVEDVQRLLILYCLFFVRHIHCQDDEPLDKLQLTGRSQLRAHELASLHSCASDSERVMFVMLWLRRRLNQASWAHTRENGQSAPVGGVDDGQPLVRSSALSLLDKGISDSIENFQEACRLAFVPMPFPYAQVIKFLLLLFLTVTPFAFVDDLQEGTPAGAAQKNLRIHHDAKAYPKDWNRSVYFGNCFLVCR